MPSIKGEMFYGLVLALGAFLLGGLLFALIMTPLTYFMVLRLVRRHRERAARNRKRV